VSNSNPTASDVRELVDLVTAHSLAADAPYLAGTDIPALIVPDGWTVKPLIDPRYLEHPQRKGGEFQFENPADFAAYVLEHCTDGTTVWLTPGGRSIGMTAIVDDHSQAEAGWGEHRAHLTLRTGTAWQRIRDVAGKALSQREFSELLDDLQDVLVDPTGSDLLTLVDTMEGTATQKVLASNISGHSARITLEAGQSVKSASGLEVPTKIVAELQPYRHLEFGLRVVLRVRIIVVDGHLTFVLTIVKAEDLVEAAETFLLDTVRAALNGRPVWRGTPTR